MPSTETQTKRSWLSPFTAIAFVAVAITGLLMLFHVRVPGMTLLHELGGLLFVIVSVLHLRLNWRPLVACCRQRKGRVALCVGGATMVLFVFLGFAHDAGHRRHGRPFASPDCPGNASSMSRAR